MSDFISPSMPGCCAYGCSNSAANGYKLYRIPDGNGNAERKKIWLRRIGRRDPFNTTTAKLCEVHFDETQWEKVREDGQRKLKSSAVPSLFQYLYPTINTEPYFKKPEVLRKKRKLPLEMDFDGNNIVSLNDASVADDAFKNNVVCSNMMKDVVIQDLKKQLWDANVKIAELELEVRSLREKLYAIEVEKSLNEQIQLENCNEA